jgi:hypothetical protein
VYVGEIPFGSVSCGISSPIAQMPIRQETVSAGMWSRPKLITFDSTGPIFKVRYSKSLIFLFLQMIRYGILSMSRNKCGRRAFASNISFHNFGKNLSGSKMNQMAFKLPQSSINLRSVSNSAATRSGHNKVNVHSVRRSPCQRVLSSVPV